MNILPISVFGMALLYGSMLLVQQSYIIDQGKRLKQLEQAMLVYVKETK